MYTTRDVYGNPRFIIHFLDLVHEDHPGRVFGGGFVFQVYGLDLLIDELYNDIYEKDR